MNIERAFTEDDARLELRAYLKTVKSKLNRIYSIAQFEYSGGFWAIRARVYSIDSGGLYGTYGFHVRKGKITVINRERDRESDDFC